MMKTSLCIVTGLLTVLFVSCATSRKDFKEPELASERYRTIAIQKYGQKVEYLFNADKTVVLCLQKSKPSSENPQQRVSFFVFDLSNDSTIFEDNIANGSVRWRDDFSVLVNIVPGIVKSDESSSMKKSGYIFDCRSKTTKSLDASTVE